MGLIGRIYYGHGKKKKKHRDILKDFFEKEYCKFRLSSAKLLKICHDKYIDMKYAPDPPGKGFIKAKIEFNSLASKQNINKQCEQKIIDWGQ
jgi:hypothetical protein